MSTIKFGVFFFDANAIFLALCPICVRAKAHKPDTNAFFRRNYFVFVEEKKQCVPAKIAPEPNQPLSPRFGNATSNTAELSVNSMFDTARGLRWMDALEKLIDVMVRRICSYQAKHEGKGGSKILPRVERLINRRWEATDAISVIELENGCDVYTTSSCDYGEMEDEDDDPRSLS